MKTESIHTETIKTPAKVESIDEIFLQESVTVS